MRLTNRKKRAPNKHPKSKVVTEEYKARIRKELAHAFGGGSLMWRQKPTKNTASLGLDKTVATFAGNTIMCDIAKNDSDKIRGMQIYSSISPDHAMWFPYKQDYVSFHMAAVKFPLDLVFFVREHNHYNPAKQTTTYAVTKIVANAQPGDRSIISAGPIDGVLEVLGGYCQVNQIIVGDKLIFHGYM